MNRLRRRAIVTRWVLVFICSAVYIDSVFAWTSPVDITNLTGVREVGPGLAHDALGNLYLVWFGNGSTNGADGDASLWRIWFQSHNGAGWSAANSTPLSGTGAGSPEIAVDSSNNLHVVYDEDQEIYYLKRTGGNWSAPL